LHRRIKPKRFDGDNGKTEVNFYGRLAPHNCPHTGGRAADSWFMTMCALWIFFFLLLLMLLWRTHWPTDSVHYISCSRFTAALLSCKIHTNVHDVWLSGDTGNKSETALT